MKQLLQAFPTDFETADAHCEGRFGALLCASFLLQVSEFALDGVRASTVRKGNGPKCLSRGCPIILEGTCTPQISEVQSEDGGAFSTGSDVHPTLLALESLQAKD